jgi:hypothetical protein
VRKAFALVLLLLLTLVPVGSTAQSQHRGQPQSEDGYVFIQMILLSAKDKDAVRAVFGRGRAKIVWRTEEFQAQLTALEKRGYISSQSKDSAGSQVGLKFTLTTGTGPVLIVPGTYYPRLSEPSIYLNGVVNQVAVGGELLFRTHISVNQASYDRVSRRLSQIHFKEVLYTQLGETAVVGGLADQQTRARHRRVFVAITISRQGPANTNY